MLSCRLAMQVFMQDPAQLKDALRRFLDAVPRRNDFFGSRSLKVRTGVRHDPVAGSFERGIRSIVADDGMEGDAACHGQYR